MPTEKDTWDLTQMFENKEVGNEPEKICACFGHPDRFCS